MRLTIPSSTTASPAVSSVPDRPRPGGLCAIHQPNFLPRLSTLAKLFAADYWIVLDDVQFNRRDYQHRARVTPLREPEHARWLTIPTHLPHGRRTLIRDALIVDPDTSQRRTTGVLSQSYASSPHWPLLSQALEPLLRVFGRRRTAAVAETSTRILLNLLGWRGQILRSSDLPARPGRSQRLADLAAATGARSYLCGTGGMKYLDTALFTARGITVLPFVPPPGDLWDAGRSSTSLSALMAIGPDELAAELRSLTHALAVPTTTTQPTLCGVNDVSALQH